MGRTKKETLNKKKDNFNILTKVQYENAYLDKVNGSKFHGEFTETSGSPDVSLECSIKTLDDKELVMSASFNISFEQFFNLSLEYIAEFKCLEKVTKEEIEDNLDTFSALLGNINTLVTGFLTEKMMGSPPFIV